MSIIVLGSLNMDLVATAPHLPGPGETLIGDAFVTVPGGKGANQAVACARLGAATRMIGRVGDDAFGAALRRQLEQAGADVRGVRVDAARRSGVALITVDARGENTIVVIPGANAAVGGEELAQLEAALPQARALLLQLEVPLETVIQAARLAKKHGTPVVLDPAPVCPLPDELYGLIDVLTPNEIEAAALVGFALDGDGAAERAALSLVARGFGCVIIKRGARGATVAAESGARHFAALPVAAVDTVAAGDAFNGGLAVALADGRPRSEAVRWALAAGAVAVTRAGAQAAMPSRADVLALLK